MLGIIYQWLHTRGRGEGEGYQNVELGDLLGLNSFLKCVKIWLNSVNSQKMVRLSFPSLVFLVRLSFKIISKLKRLGKKLVTQMKAVYVNVQNMT